MKDFIVKICGTKVHVVYSYKKPLYIFCRYRNTEKRRLSNEQIVCVKTKGALLDGQVCLCSSDDAPILLFEKTCKEDWNEELIITLQREMEINKKFEIYIKEKIDNMIDSMSMNLKLMPFCNYFKSLRSIDFVVRYMRKRGCLLNKRSTPKIKIRTKVIVEKYYVKDQYGSNIYSGYDLITVKE